MQHKPVFFFFQQGAGFGSHGGPEFVRHAGEGATRQSTAENLAGGIAQHSAVLGGHGLTIVLEARSVVF